MYRQIVTPENNQLLLQIPNEYIGQKLEVLAFPVGNSAEISVGKKKLPRKKTDKEAEAFYRSINIDMSKFKFDREKAHER